MRVKVEQDEEKLKEMLLPGQKYKSPVEGESTRLFYESLYE